MKLAPALVLVFATTAAAAPRPLAFLIRNFTAHRGSAPATVRTAVGANVVFQESFIATTGRECEGTVPTPAVGSPLAYVRTGTAACVRSNGTLVTLSANAPRITTNGYLAEAGATNNVIRSEEIENAAWTDVAVVVAAPVLNGANAGGSPDGTTTADDYTFAATGAAEVSARTRIAGCSAGTQRSASVWVKGVSGSGTMDLCVETTDAVAWTCTSCAYTSTDWARCLKQAANVTSGGDVIIGNASLYNGAVTRASNRVYVWGAQCEVGLIATSYIATAGAAASRSADAMTTATPNVVGTLGCGSLDYIPLGTAVTAGLATWSDTSRVLYTNVGATQMRAYNGVVEPNVASASTAGVSRLYRVTWSTGANQLIIASPSETLSTTDTHASWVGGTASLSIGFSQGAGTQSKGSLRNLVLGTATGACP